MIGITAMASGAHVVLQAGCLLSDHNFCTSVFSQVCLMTAFYLAEFLRWHYQLSCKLNWDIEMVGSLHAAIILSYTSTCVIF